MASDNKENTRENKEPGCCNSSKGNVAGVSSGVYGLAFIGALVYYIQHAETFAMGLYGFVKAMLWPAFVIYRLLEYLKM